MKQKQLSVLISLLLVGSAAVASVIPVDCNTSHLVAAINQANAESGDTIELAAGCTYSFVLPDNYWYGANALPAVKTAMTIEGNGATIARSSSPGTAPLRLFYVSGGISAELSAGALTLRNLTIANGLAKGGNATGGGGGAGMGGAIFNQGQVSAESVTFSANTARGGDSSVPSGSAGNGGGIGEDATTRGGGFGGNFSEGVYGGAGGIPPNYSTGGSGGGGFGSADDGVGSTVNTGGTGGGLGKLGGRSGGQGGDGGGGGSITHSSSNSGSGGGFGFGGLQGDAAGGGGGVGGGGGTCGNFGGGGGAGGFGGGGAAGYDAVCVSKAQSVFGGGLGSVFIGTCGGGGGFGGGGGSYTDCNGSVLAGGGGAGLGGAIFNHAGTISLLNCTLAMNSAIGGTTDTTGNSVATNGSGLGAAIFNLNGSVDVSFSTIAQNSVSGSNGGAAALGPGGGTIYSLAFGNKIQDGTASLAGLSISNSIVHGTVGVNGAGSSDMINNVVAGTNPANTGNTATLAFVDANIVGSSSNLATLAGGSTTPLASDPLLGAFGADGVPGAPSTMSIGGGSPALNAAVGACPPTDERGVARPQFGTCDIGAYEAAPNEDRIFENGFN